MELTTRSALAIWQQSLAQSVRQDAPDLSARQMALMLMVYVQDPPHTVRGLSEALNISKPAVVRALDMLGRLDFVRRRRDPNDRRNVLLQRTVKGSVYLSEFADLIITSAREI